MLECVDRFRTLTAEDFESYYPDRFAAQRDDALALSDRERKREAKRVLLDAVRAWIAQDPESARAEFEQSAVGVIAALREIEAALAGDDVTAAPSQS
jgi:hypothetical protein